MSRIEHATTRLPNSSSTAYCSCEFPNSQTLYTHHGDIGELVTCQCGEMAATQNCEWHWLANVHEANTSADTAAIIAPNGKDITFHPSYSHGTAIVRGDKPLQPGRLHYWEMRTITVLSGTDVMFGIGTEQLDLNGFQFHFVSGLGTNGQSWGFSYQGRLQHNGQLRPYGQPFSQGSIVGVLLDLTHGTMEFFLNRCSLGIAYTNIPVAANTKLYPMVCSTAARSCVRLIGACSVVMDLQCRCFAAVLSQKQMRTQLPPGLQALLPKYWFLALTATRRAATDTTDSDIRSSCQPHNSANNNDNDSIQISTDRSVCCFRRDKQRTDKLAAPADNLSERVVRPAVSTALPASLVRLTRKAKGRHNRKHDNAAQTNELGTAANDEESAAAALLASQRRHLTTELANDVQSAYHGYFHYML